MIRPTWLDCHTAGMTAAAAAKARGVTHASAYDWASKSGKHWAAAPRPTATPRKTDLFAACHARGMTANEAAAETGATVNVVRTWGYRHGKAWAPAPTAKRMAETEAVRVAMPPVPPLPPIVTADLDPMACRAMWAALLGIMLGDLTGNGSALGAGHRPRDVTDYEQAAARRWFASPDFAQVASLCGLDPDAVRERLVAA